MDEDYYVVLHDGKPVANGDGVVCYYTSREKANYAIDGFVTDNDYFGYDYNCDGCKYFDPANEETHSLKIEEVDTFLNPSSDTWWI